ncbi:MAG: molybdate ABC transporter substrate-binding protein [Thiotrichaceae bacterium]|nr:molybdate ABC transporter substrate-binding protein [Thiotrichaceae bacterium]
MQVQAEEIRAAVAGHFILPFQELAGLFERQTGHKVIPTAKSNGMLYNELKAGTVYDIFLSADVATVLNIESDDLGVLKTRFSYAFGRLALWSPDPKLIDAKGEVLKTGNFKHILIPHTERAGYGVAAKQALNKLGVWDSVENKLIMYDDAAGLLDRIRAGEAELGFVPFALLNPRKKIEGSLWIVPPKLYGNLEHQAILLKHGEHSEAAKAFLQFLKTPIAYSIIESFGYNPP